MLLELPGVTGLGTGSRRPPDVCVGVLALEMGTLVLTALDVADIGTLPFVLGRFKVAGEFERVEGELDEGLWTLRTETGSLDPVLAGVTGPFGVVLSFARRSLDDGVMNAELSL